MMLANSTGASQKGLTTILSFREAALLTKMSAFLTGSLKEGTYLLIDGAERPGMAPLLEREPVEVADRVVETAGVHYQLQGVEALREMDVRNDKGLPGLPAVGLRH